MPPVLAVAGVLLAWGLGRVLGRLDLSPPWWLSTPAVVGFYGLLWQLYDRVLWRLQLGGRTLSGIPDYSGSWNGRVHSSHDSANPYAAQLTIWQTSSRILIELRTDTSRSVSTMAMMSAEPGLGHGLQYVFTNSPRHVPAQQRSVTASPTSPASPNITPHEGVSRLQLSRDGRLEGDYQTDRHRQTHGTLLFTERVAP